MRSKTVLALVLLNLALVASLCFHSFFTTPAAAEGLGVGRPSEYLQCSGEVQGGNSGIVFTLDTRNNLLSAFTFDGKKLDAMPPIDLSRIFKKN